MALPTIAPAATPPRIPRPTAGPPQPRRHCALASVGATVSAAAIVAAAVRVVRVFIMELRTSLKRRPCAERGEGDKSSPARVPLQARAICRKFGDALQKDEQTCRFSRISGI